MDRIHGCKTVCKRDQGVLLTPVVDHVSPAKWIKGRDGLADEGDAYERVDREEVVFHGRSEPALVAKNEEGALGGEKEVKGERKRMKDEGSGNHSRGLYRSIARYPSRWICK